MTNEGRNPYPIQQEIIHAPNFETLYSIISAVEQSQLERSGVGLRQQYKGIVDAMPKYLPKEINDMAENASISGDPRGKKVLVLLNLKSILHAAEQYSDDEEQDDVLQVGVLACLELLDRHKEPLINYNQKFYNTTENGIARYIAQRDGFPYEAVKEKKHKQLQEEVYAFLDNNPTMPFRDIVPFADHLSEKFGLTFTSIADYILAQQDLAQWEQTLIESREEGSKIDINIVRKMLCDPVEVPELRQSERDVLQMRFGIYPDYSGESMTTREIGEKLGKTIDRVRQLEERGLRTLRHPQYSYKLRIAR